MTAPYSVDLRERAMARKAAGETNRQIAASMYLAEKTVKTHVGHVLAKLGVSDRTQAALVAVRAGLTDGS